MLTSTIADPRVWRADTIDSPDRWYHQLSDAALSALDQVVQAQQPGGAPVTELAAPATLRVACADDRRRISAALEEGRGFVVVTPGPAVHYTAWELQAVYWLVGQVLGQPVEQNVQGTLLYDVRDTGQDVRYGARFSVTNAESTFHTDNSFGAEVTDYVGLLCLNPAKSGGLSLIVSGQAVQQELLTRHRDAWELLRQPFHIDRRGGVRPGDAPTARYPILAGDGPELVVRYLRYWIEVGQEKVGQPLTTEQVRALDVLDRVADDPRLRVDFTLRPADMLFVNNRWIFHNRTAFEDHAEPERCRHYVRLWVRRSQ
jgi:alpha-ketoglutarate-dependent taurine dioxygenase